MVDPKTLRTSRAILIVSCMIAGLVNAAVTIDDSLDVVLFGAIISQFVVIAVAVVMEAKITR